MPINRNKLFIELFNKFLEINSDVEALIISDQEGLIIAGEKRKDIDIEIVSVLTAIINPVLERIRNEFAFKKFGTASFDTEHHRLVFISIDEKRILSLVLNHMASIEKISPYGFFLAEKVAQILSIDEGDLIQVSVPNFEYQAKNTIRLKNQLYQMKMDVGGEYRFKFVIIGNHEVGKTSIIRRFVEKKFSTDYRATIGLNILSHTFEFFGNEISVTLWDIGAQKYFRRFRKTYYLGAQAAFLVFDLTNQESFDNVTGWYEELKSFVEIQDLPIVVVGNKTDLTEQRVISYEAGVKLANKLSENQKVKLSYIETSALSGDNVEDAFNLISYHYVMKSKELEEERRSNMLYDEIKAILDKKIVFTLSFITESPHWSPGLQIISDIRQLGDFSGIRDYEDEKVFQYSNGLILKEHLYSSIDISNSDGVFCIFDARDKEHIDPKWKEIIIKMIKHLKKDGVISIGIRVSETSDWSQLIEELNVDEELNKKDVVNLLFFRIGDDYKLEVFDQLNVMLSAIKDKA
jgi:small GTP-binding protein